MAIGRDWGGIWVGSGHFLSLDGLDGLDGLSLMGLDGIVKSNFRR